MTYRVTLKDTANSFDCAADEPVLEAALRAGLFLPYGCKTGACGACRARLISGKVAHEYEPLGLSEEEVAEGYTLLCLARPRSDLVIQVRELPKHEAIRARNLPARVEYKEQLAADVMKMVLRLPKGDPFEYLPGQYVDILIEGDKRRSFSIANAPQPANPFDYPRIELHLRLTPGGTFTRYVFEEMPERAMLRLEGPLGGFYLREDSDKTALFMAGGTGFAPIKAMLEDLLPRSQGRTVHLFWGARAVQDLYMDSLPRQWQEKYPNFRYTPVLSEPMAEDNWTGAKGFVHEALLREYPQLSDADVYMSGPPPMIQAAKHSFHAAGLPTERLFYDSFDYAWQVWPAAPPT
ncbi:MAG: CDP-6-deoxy-delta-3,4-glucoseen reductase [Nevskiales bacterium]